MAGEVVVPRWQNLAAELSADLRKLQRLARGTASPLGQPGTVRELGYRTGWSKSTVSQVLRGEPPGIVNSGAVLAVARHLTLINAEHDVFSDDLAPREASALWRSDLRMGCSFRAMREWTMERPQWVDRIAELRRAWEASRSRLAARPAGRAVTVTSAPTAPNPGDGAAAVSVVPSGPAVPGVYRRLGGAVAVEAEVGAVVDGWLAGYRSAETIRAYQRELGAFLTWCEHPHGRPPIPVLQARGDDIADYVKQVLEQPRTLVSKHGKTRVIAPTAATRARALAVLSSFYTYAHGKGVAAHNPVSGPRPKISRAGTTPALTVAQATALLDAAFVWPYGPSRRAAALVYLMMTTTIGVGEALGADLDQLGHDRGHPVLWMVHNKAQDLLPVPLAPMVVYVLTEYLLARPQVSPPAKAGGWPTAPAGTALLATASGARWSEASVHQLIRRLAAAAHLPEANTIRPHSLRVTARRYLGALVDLDDPPTPPWRPLLRETGTRSWW